jgi:hypothetical protein
MTFIIIDGRKRGGLSGRSPKKVNASITKQVTDLHKRGFGFDFCLTPDNCLYCVQNNHIYKREQICVELVNQGYDKLIGSFRYIHKVETDCGEKGILMLRTIYFNPLVPAFEMPDPG